MTGLELAAIARSWIGVPWVHQGRSREGVDCAGLLIVVAREAGLILPPSATDYTMAPQGSRLRRECDAQLRRVTAIQPGHVLLIRFEGEAERHLALAADYREGLSMIHALNRGSTGRVVEHRLDARWRSRIAAAYAVPGVAHE